MAEIELTSDERTLLQRLRSLNSNTIVRLRTALGWDVARFASTLVGLQERDLVSRDGIFLSVSQQGSLHLHNAARKQRPVSQVPFREQSVAPQLPVTSLYLPDYARFLRASTRSLYTHDVSPTDPD